MVVSYYNVRRRVVVQLHVGHIRQRLDFRVLQPWGRCRVPFLVWMLLLLWSSCFNVIKVMQLGRNVGGWLLPLHLWCGEALTMMLSHNNIRSCGELQ